MMIFLPGTDKQLDFLLENFNPEGKSILIAGTLGDKLAIKLEVTTPSDIQIITDSSDELAGMRLRLKGKALPAKLMDYTSTDYKDKQFDIIFVQGTFTVSPRRRIYKEMKRILKEDGIICVGEVITSKEDVPRFMQDIWDTSGIVPLTKEKQVKFYEEAGFEIIAEKNLSYTLKEFYRTGKGMLQEYLKGGTEDEKKFYKKLIKKISHESNVYLDLGGSRYMEFHAFIMKRK
jgi:SAM-dependent methyltransferase